MNDEPSVSAASESADSLPEKPSPPGSALPIASDHVSLGFSLATVALLLASLFALAPFGLPVFRGRWLLMALPMSYLGTMAALPAGIALWATLTPRSWMTRWPQGLFLCGLATVATNAGSVFNNHPPPAPSLLFYFVPSYLLATAVFVLIRRFARWELQTLLPGAALQFSLRRAMLWMFQACLVFAALRAIRLLAPVGTSPLATQQSPQSLLLALLAAAVGGAASVPAFLVALAALSRTWMLVWTVVAVGLHAAVAIILIWTTAIAGMPVLDAIVSFVWLVLGAGLSTAYLMLLLRAFGYRLVREPRGEEAATKPPPPEDPNRRAALGLLVSAGVALALALWPMTHWRAEARRSDFRRRTSNLQVDTKTNSLFYSPGGSFSNGALQRMQRYPQTTFLSLEYTALRDEQLADVVKLDKLTYLNLRGTLITDRAVPALSRLKNLRQLDLRRTRVTDRAVKKLQGALPKCTIRH